MQRAVYAGTFDMPTKGHESVISYAADMVQHLVVAIGVNQDKKTMFTLPQRMDMLTDIARQYSNVSVETFNVNEYLVDYAERIGARYIVRGLRNIFDLIEEQVMCAKNHTINPRIKTIFVITDHKYSNVASSTVKKMMGPVGWERAVREEIPEVMWPRFIRLVHENGIIVPSR